MLPAKSKAVEAGSGVQVLKVDNMQIPSVDEIIATTTAPIASFIAGVSQPMFWLIGLSVAALVASIMINAIPAAMEMISRKMKSGSKWSEPED